jgi:hypothetical protein
VTQLNLHPLRWLSSPQVVGTETVAGASTTHIHAGVNVPALLSDLGKLLKNTPSLGLGGAGSALSPSTINLIAGAVQSPTFDLWTGTSDRTLRQLRVHLLIQVPSQFSSVLGGLQSAGVGLTMQYSDLNQPQTITAPTNLQPYSQLQAKLATLFSALRSELGGLFSGGLGSSQGPSASGSPGTGGSHLQKYSACIQRAGGDVAKMQKCAPLLSGK